jgi:hypothetical protein
MRMGKTYQSEKQNKNERENSVQLTRNKNLQNVAEFVALL